MPSAHAQLFSDHGDGRVMIETAPDGLLLVVGAGEAYRVGTGLTEPGLMPGGFVIGAQSAYGSSALEGHVEGVQVQLSWAAAVATFGPELADLADRAVAITELPGGAELVERLTTAARSDRHRLVRAWLHGRAGSGRQPSALLVRALERIRLGSVSVDDLATELGCSRGHLHRVVRASVGQPPSTLIRVARLHRLIRTTRAGSTTSLATLAAEAGFADHAHLCHETRRLAGRTPAELVTDQVT